MKLTPAQRNTLLSNMPIRFSPRFSSAWTQTHMGSSVRVNIATFNALVLKGLLHKVDNIDLTELYDLTAAGRAALAENGGDG